MLLSNHALNNNKMETYQIVLMVIGAITSVWMVVKIGRGILFILDQALKASFREKYPHDFEINLRWVIAELKSHGYRKNAEMDAGSDNPGVMMKSHETGTEMEVRLRAPLLSHKKQTIVVVNHSYKTAIVMPDDESDVNKRLLEMFIETDTQKK